MNTQFKKIICFGLISILLFNKTTMAMAETAAEKKPLTKLVVILDWFLNPDHAPLVVAQQQGFFKAQGLKVEFITPSDPNDPPKLIAAGKGDIAITYQPQLLMQVQQGLPLTRIATLIATPLNCLAVSATGPIHTLADLKGKRIAYAGGVDNAILAVMLQQQGLSLNDMTLINVHFNLTQALLTNKVDGVIGIVRNFELIQMALAHFPVRVFYPEEYGMPPYDELIFVVHHDKLLDKRWPRFIKAVELGTQYLINHPQESWQAFAKTYPELNNELNRQAWFATLPRFALSPAALDHSRYQNYAHFLKQQGFIKTEPTLSSYAVDLGME